MGTLHRNSIERRRKKRTLTLKIILLIFSGHLLHSARKQIQQNFNGSKTFGTINMFETGVVRFLKVNHSIRRHNRDLFSIFFIMKVYYVFSLESPQRGDSNEYTRYTIFNMNKKNTLITLNLQLWDFFHGTQERVRSSRGKRAISVRAIEVLLYLFPC